MDDLAPILVVGFIVLGIYKLFELFVRKKERLILIEKLPLILNEDNKKINLPSISLGSSDSYANWALRISLLLIGIGLGSIFSILMQTTDFFKEFMSYIYEEMGYSRGIIRDMLNLSWITFMGGLGLFGAYLIETKKENKRVEKELSSRA